MENCIVIVAAEGCPTQCHVAAEGAALVKWQHVQGGTGAQQIVAARGMHCRVWKAEVHRSLAPGGFCCMQWWQ